jgi:hypothetical protein
LESFEGAALEDEALINFLSLKPIFLGKELAMVFNCDKMESINLTKKQQAISQKSVLVDILVYYQNIPLSPKLKNIMMSSTP